MFSIVIIVGITMFLSVIITMINRTPTTIDTNSIILASKGKTAQATIIKIEPIGITKDSNDYSFRVTLEVQPNDAATFPVITHYLASLEHSLKEGSTVTVLYDPSNTQNLQITS